MVEATQCDAAFLAYCRTEMLRELDGESADTTDESVARLTDWAGCRIARGEVAGWVALGPDGPVGGVMALEYDMLPMSAAPDGRIGRLVGMYVVPTHRKRGLARALAAAAVGGLHAAGVRIVRLGASDAGRSVYESLGFEEFPEMGILLPEPEVVDE